VSEASVSEADASLPEAKASLPEAEASLPEAEASLPEADALDRLLRAVLYEGYALYPYRPSALKNQRRFAFGVVYPRAWAEREREAAHVRVEVIASAHAAAMVSARIVFLRLLRGGGAREEAFEVAPRAIGAPGDAGAQTAAIERPPLQLELETEVAAAGPGLWRYSLELRNETRLPPGADREAAMDHAPASTHVVLRLAGGGTLVSAIEPPPHAAAAVAACRSSGLYPVLAGGGAMLASPIILPDRPELATESPGDFFDSTEIDELLTLRVLLLTDNEKREAAAADPRVAALLARTEALGLGATARLHGAVRTPWPRPGTRVRLAPARRADAFDVLLRGRLATVAAVERDLDGNVHCAVTLDDDPGADLGADGLPGHRFFFAPDELEVIA
jgi:hypothetical protein